MYSVNATVLELDTDQNARCPHFAGLFSFLQDTPRSYLKYYWPYTSNTLNFSILYQNARHKFCRTLSRICRTAGYNFKAKKQDSPAKSRTVGNYGLGTVSYLCSLTVGGGFKKEGIILINKVIDTGEDLNK